MNSLYCHLPTSRQQECARALLSELVRLKPDTLIMHHPVDDLRYMSLLECSRHTPDIFRIFSLDDLITDIPISSPQYAKVSVDIMKERMAIALKASNRMIVTTEPG